MSELTHIREIIPNVLEEAARKQLEEHPDKMTSANRRRIDEFLERIGGEMPGGEYERN